MLKGMIKTSDGRCFFKGNLHTHTTSSDGEATPEQAIEIYKGAGYDFLALTDHWVFTQGQEEEGFLLLSGCEYNIGMRPQDGVFHFVGIGGEAPPDFADDGTEIMPQDIIDGIRSKDGLAILAHPAWSINRPEDLIKLQGLDGVEIYNTTSAPPWNCRPYSGNILDDLAVRGMYLPCMAADDAHWYNGDQTRSYIMVEAEELSRGAIMAAIRNGSFYATQGPQIFVSINNGDVIVDCLPGEGGAPICEVIFFTDALYVSDRVTFGEDIKRAVHRLTPNATFVRVEAMDIKGNFAWSSYYEV